MPITHETRQRLAQALRQHHMPASRVLRALSAPLKTATIAAMRRSGRQRRVACPLIWGDSFHGPVPEAVTSLIWRYGFYEAKTTIFLLEMLREGATFVDVGAHFGYFSMLASRLVGASGRVVAIEAMPGTFAMLENNVAQNALANVAALNIAGADADGPIVFRDFGIVNSSLNTMFAPRGALQDTAQAGRDVQVTGKRLDGVFAERGVERIDMIKIDAESSEENVLRGLEVTLARDRPVVIVELGGGDAEEDARAARIVALMAGHGHRPFAFDGRELHAIGTLERLPYVNAFFLTETHADAMPLGAPFSDAVSSV